MNKVPPWFWLFVAAFAIVGVVFLAVGLPVGAFFTPVSQLPAIYWITLGLVIAVFASFAIWVFGWQIFMSRVNPAGLLLAVIGNAIASACTFSIVVLFILLDLRLGGLVVFLAAMGVFNLSVAGIGAARLERVRRGR